MELDQTTKRFLGVLLILLGLAALVWPGDAGVYGLGMRFPVITFVLLCGGLWLLLRGPAKGAK